MILIRRKILCEVCNKKYSPSVYAKWHGCHCKELPINKLKYELRKISNSVSKKQ